MEHSWNVTCWGKTELLGETPRTALSTTNLTWTPLGHNLNLRGKRLGANCPSYDTACCSFFSQNYLVQKYKSKDSLSLNRLWAISVLQCAANDGAYKPQVTCLFHGAQTVEMPDILYSI